MYESGVLDSNGVYRLQGDKLVPHEDAWASIPSVSLLDSKEVTTITTSHVLSGKHWMICTDVSKKYLFQKTCAQTGSVWVYTNLNISLLSSFRLI